MTDEFRDKVMSLIEKRHVAMRPRWHFLLLSALISAGVLLLVVTLLYIVSLALFFMRESGVWYAPAFGGRGWFALLHSAPIFLIVLVALFATLLEILVRKYSFAYRAPLTISLGGILALVFIGGFMLAQTSLHRKMEFAARHGRLPPPMGMWYHAMRPPPPGDMYRGVIVLREPGGFVIVGQDGEGTSTIRVTPKTRLPLGQDFSEGDMIMVIGDVDGTNTVRAFGIRKIEIEE